ncbi:MAG TPA: hypothetical protein VHS96_17730 [Bacteroidia bacterium]|nr:hypothetical protein [Bacteroidia bacterium]
MRHTRLLGLLLLLSMPFAACFNNDGDCDPTLICDTFQPTTASIYLTLTTNAENTVVPLAVYLGNASDSNLYFRDTVGSSASYSLPIEQRYSVVAKYRQRGATVYAVDGGRISYNSTTNCNETCYTTKDLSLNLKLID